MNPQFKKGALELCVLSKLVSLYLVLKRMKDEEYVDTYLVESEEGPARKYYHLTEQGKQYQESLKAEWQEFVDAVGRLIG